MNTVKDITPELLEAVALVEKAKRLEASRVHGERIGARRKANRPWNEDGS